MVTRAKVRENVLRSLEAVLGGAKGVDDAMRDYPKGESPWHTLEGFETHEAQYQAACALAWVAGTLLADRAPNIAVSLLALAEGVFRDIERAKNAN